jgi:hypothetical protein
MLRTLTHMYNKVSPAAIQIAYLVVFDFGRWVMSDYVTPCQHGLAVMRCQLYVGLLVLIRLGLKPTVFAKRLLPGLTFQQPVKLQIHPPYVLQSVTVGTSLPSTPASSTSCLLHHCADCCCSKSCACCCLNA